MVFALKKLRTVQEINVVVRLHYGSSPFLYLLGCPFSFRRMI